MARQALTDIAFALGRTQHLLAMTHVSPDGDAIGSLLGFGWLMRDLGKTVSLVCQDPVPPELRFLPGAETISGALPDVPWDAVVVLDASDPLRLGSLFRPSAWGAAPVIILDHHITNVDFGSLNYVQPEAAATAQVLVSLADAMGAPIGRPAAVCLLAGLVTDTRGFRTSNVSADVLRTALRLVESGASLAETTERTLNYKPTGMMRLWGLALAEMQVQDGISSCQITRSMRHQAGAPVEGDAGLVSFLLNAPEAVLSAVFSEKADGSVDVSFRARPGRDVSRLALSLGGGGHPQASGCTIPGPLPVAAELVLGRLRDIASGGI